MNENETPMQHISEAGMMVSNMIPNMSYFESRFDILQNNYEEVRRNQDNFREQLRDMKLDMDRRFNESRSYIVERFAQVDKRIDDTRSEMLERFSQVDKRFEQVEKRFEKVDKSLELIIKSIDKLGDKIDQKDERQRKFTLRMFSIAMSVTGLSIMGVLVKILNII